MNNIPALKPCPFCGDIAPTLRQLGGYWRVICEGFNCKVWPETAPMPTEREAAVAWNKRAKA